MKEFLELFSNHTFCVVALGSSLLGILSGGLGCFAVLRKESLLGDGIAHCALPGVILAFLIIGEKNLFILLTGGSITGLLGCLLVIFITKHSRIKFDSALAMVLAVFFGGAMVLLTISQKIPNGNQGGLNSFIYGQPASMLKSDVQLIFWATIFCFTMVIIFWKQLKILCFDQDFAHTLGYPVKKIQLMLSFLLIITILIGLQTVGAILMSAMLVSPAVSARRFTNSLGTMVLISLILGGVAGFLGTVTSSLSPTIPTGAVIVAITTSVALLSILFGKNDGVILKIIHRQKQKKGCELCQKYK